MIAERPAIDGASTGWRQLVRLRDSAGSAAHPHLRRLLAPDAGQRDLSDAVHALCMLHGHHPGLVAAALAQCVQPEARLWLDGLAAAFVQERTMLVTVSALVGPLPPTPGQAATEATLAASRHAIETLARSDRRGCASGAVAALAIDWPVIRRVVDAAAARFAIDHAPSPLPEEERTVVAVEELGATPACARAIGFGAEQLFHQHRGLWDLLEARAAARMR